jgi:cell wall-associated NlpC family hydrolase
MGRPRRPASCRAGLAALSGALVVCLVSSPGVAAAALPPAAPTAPTAPGDGQVAAARDARNTAVRQLSDLATRLTQARAQVDTANAAAAIALDTYQARQADQQAAQATAESTAATARQAVAALAAARAEVAAFARESYIQGTTSPGLQAMLDTDDPAQLLERARLLAAAGGHKADVLVQFAAAQRAAVAAHDAAQAALVQASTLEQQAADAMHAAEQVEVAARQQAAEFEAEQSDLLVRVQQAQQVLADLEGAQAAALEYARRQAAAETAETAAHAAAAGGNADGSARETALPPVGPGSGSAAAAAVLAALDWVGTSYAWGGGTLGGPGPGFGIDAGVVGFDCSGLTRYAYAQAGIDIARNSRAQYAALPKVHRADLRPGDLVFWALDVSDPATIHHVALYLGGGEIVEAPFSGATVHVTPMYWSGYLGAVRPSA